MLAPGVLLCPTLHTPHLYPVYLLWEGAGFGAPQALEVASQLTVTLPQTVPMIPSSLKATTTYSYITASAEHPPFKEIRPGPWAYTRLLAPPLSMSVAWEPITPPFLTAEYTLGYFR